MNSTYDQFLHFRAVIIRAVAKAWADENYLQQFQADPKKALETAFAYKYPFDYDLELQTGTASYTPGAVLGWTVHKREKLTLVLPPKPAPVPGDEMAQALNEAQALAAFNANNISFLHASKE